MANGQLLTTIADSDWRLVQGPTDTPVPGNQFVREVQNIDASVVESLRATALGTLAISNPYIDGVQKTGTYYLSDCGTIKQGGGPYEGSATLRETLTLVLAGTATGTLTTKIRMEGKDILNAFALRSTTEEFVSDQYRYLNPANEAAIEALSITPPTGYTEVKRRTDIEERGDRTCTLNVLYKKISGLTAWGGAPDIIDYFDVGSKAGQAVQGEVNGMVKFWFGIQKSDQATAIAAIRDGTGSGVPDTGYIVTRAYVHDNQDGSLTFEQTIVKQVVSKDLTGQTIVDPFGYYPGTLDQIETVYDNYTATDVGSISEAVPSGYKLIRVDPQLSGTFYRITYLYRKATWVNTTPTGTVMAEYGGDAPKDEESRQVVKYFGVPIAQVPANIQTLKTNADDAGFLTEEVSATVDNDTGHGVITRTRKRVNTGNDVGAYVVAQMTFDARLGVAGIWTGIHVYWPSLKASAADALLTALATTTNFVFAAYGIVGTQFRNSQIMRKVNKDGTVQVDLVCINDIYENLIPDGDQIVYLQYKAYIGNAVYTVNLARRITQNIDNAVSWAGASSTLPAGARNQNSPAGLLGGKIEWNDKLHRYEAIREWWDSAGTYKATPVNNP